MSTHDTAPPTHPAPLTWTAEVQAAFLRELANTHNVTHAARAVGMSRQSAYQLRQRLRGQPFDRAWIAAFETVRRSLYHAALERAINGVEVPTYYAGEQVGTTRRFDERLTLALLAMKDPMPLPPILRYEPGSVYENAGFDVLLERVRSGPERWSRGDCLFPDDTELDAIGGGGSDAG